MARCFNDMARPGGPILVVLLHIHRTLSSRDPVTYEELLALIRACFEGQCCVKPTDYVIEIADLLVEVAFYVVSNERDMSVRFRLLNEMFKLEPFLFAIKKCAQEKLCNSRLATIGKVSATERVKGSKLTTSQPAQPELPSTGQVRRPPGLPTSTSQMNTSSTFGIAPTPTLINRYNFENPLSRPVDATVSWRTRVIEGEAAERTDKVPGTSTVIQQGRKWGSDAMTTYMQCLKRNGMDVLTPKETMAFVVLAFFVIGNEVDIFLHRATIEFVHACSKFDIIPGFKEVSKTKTRCVLTLLKNAGCFEYFTLENGHLKRNTMPPRSSATMKLTPSDTSSGRSNVDDKHAQTATAKATYLSLVPKSYGEMLILVNDYLEGNFLQAVQPVMPRALSAADRNLIMWDDKEHLRTIVATNALHEKKLRAFLKSEKYLKHFHSACGDMDCSGGISGIGRVAAESLLRACKAEGRPPMKLFLVHPCSSQPLADVWSTPLSVPMRKPATSPVEQSLKEVKFRDTTSAATDLDSRSTLTPSTIRSSPSSSRGSGAWSSLTQSPANSASDTGGHQASGVGAGDFFPFERAPQPGAAFANQHSGPLDPTNVLMAGASALGMAGDRSSASTIMTSPVTIPSTRDESPLTSDVKMPPAPASTSTRAPLAHTTTQWHFTDREFSQLLGSRDIFSGLAPLERMVVTDDTDDPLELLPKSEDQSPVPTAGDDLGEGHILHTGLFRSSLPHTRSTSGRFEENSNAEG